MLSLKLARIDATSSWQLFVLMDAEPMVSLDD
jgi:hypothetical protein